MSDDKEGRVLKWLAAGAMMHNARQEFGDAISVIAATRRELNDTLVALGRVAAARDALRAALEKIADRGVANRVRPTGERQAEGCLTCMHWWDVGETQHHDSDCAHLIARAALDEYPNESHPT